MRLIFGILLVLPVLAFCCEEGRYEKDGQCCKMCGPGKRMKLNTECEDPSCEECKTGEYQDGYTNETKCKPQPSCDRNLNFVVQASPSKTQFSPCECIPDHHCSDSDCASCVQNTVCKPGEKVSKIGTRMSDTECEPCPQGTFSHEDSATSCMAWTECSQGQTETLPGSSKSDRICEAQNHVRVGVCIAVVVLVLAAAVVFIIYYRKVRSGSACLDEKVQKYCPVLCHGINNNNHQPIEDNVTVENEQDDQMMMPPVNMPQEDTEDPAKQDDNFKNGLSANGMPVDQDHSKTSLLSQPETGPSGGSYSSHQ